MVVPKKYWKIAVEMLKIDSVTMPNGTACKLIEVVGPVLPGGDFTPVYFLGNLESASLVARVVFQGIEIRGILVIESPGGFVITSARFEVLPYTDTQLHQWSKATISSGIGEETTAEAA